jgi:hypothetical protein
LSPLLPVLGLLALVLALNPLQVALSAPDGLDPTFGSGGQVTTDLGGSRHASSIVLQADGQSVVTGEAGISSEFAQARHDVQAGELVLHRHQNPDPNGWAVRFPGSQLPLGDDWLATTTGPVDELHL